MRAKTSFALGLTPRFSHKQLAPERPHIGGGGQQHLLMWMLSKKRWEGIPTIPGAKKASFVMFDQIFNSGPEASGVRVQMVRWYDALPPKCQHKLQLPAFPNETSQGLAQCLK